MRALIIADIAHKVFTACIDAIAITAFVGTVIVLAALLTSGA